MPTLAEFNLTPPAAATAMLRPCCASTRWLAEIAAGRPYPTLADLQRASTKACAELTGGDLAQALSAHPRIGDRAAGEDAEAAWSRQEQAGTAGADQSVTEQLRQGNLEYEQRFGQVFLICASGRTAAEMLAQLQARLGNDPAAEQLVVRAELAQIVSGRLSKTFALS